MLRIASVKGSSNARATDSPLDGILVQHRIASCTNVRLPCSWNGRQAWRTQRIPARETDNRALGLPSTVCQNTVPMDGYIDGSQQQVYTTKYFNISTRKCVHVYKVYTYWEYHGIYWFIIVEHKVLFTFSLSLSPFWRLKMLVGFLLLSAYWMIRTGNHRTQNVRFSGNAFDKRGIQTSANRKTFKRFASSSVSVITTIN